MINYKENIVAALTTILSTYYELFVDSNTSLPCITYTEYNNIQRETGDTMCYSTIQYMVKLWGKTLSDMETYKLSIDSNMRDLGFKRTNYAEVTLDDEICYQMLYEGRANENY